MAFFKKQGSLPGHANAHFANQLYKALAQKRKIMRRPNLFQWSREFSIIKEAIEEAHLSNVLGWYCQNIGKPYVPLAFSARAFREKFFSIEAAMFRDIGHSIEVSEEAQQLTDKLYTFLNWPKITPEQLAQSIQLSLNNYRIFLQTTKLFPLPIKNKLAPPTTFVEQWFREVHSRIADWQDWSGNIQQQAFHPEHKRFRAKGRSWASDYCGDPNRWDQLMENNG